MSLRDFELNQKRRNYIYNNYHDGWIAINLLNYGNCLIPKKLIRKYGEKELKKYYEEAIGKKITVTHWKETKDTVFNTSEN